MVEKEMRSKFDFLEFIEEICKEKSLKISNLEEETGMSKGLISRWKNNNYGSDPKLSNMLKICQFLNLQIILRTDELEANSGVEESKQISDEDIIVLVMKILKNGMYSSEKQKLYKILKILYNV